MANVLECLCEPAGPTVRLEGEPVASGEIAAYPAGPRRAGAAGPPMAAPRPPREDDTAGTGDSRRRAPLSAWRRTRRSPASVFLPGTTAGRRCRSYARRGRTRRHTTRRSVGRRAPSHDGAAAEWTEVKTLALKRWLRTSCGDHAARCPQAATEKTTLNSIGPPSAVFSLQSCGKD